MIIRYTHPNGYSALLYGESSMSVCVDGKEIMHTGSRSVNTKGEVMELLERYPEHVKILERELDNLLNESDEVSI